MTAVRVSYRVDGPAGAPVVVLSHSLGATRDMWEPQVQALAGRFRVVGYDTRGHGDSPAPPGPYTLDDLADDVLGVLDELGVERAHVVGLSLGGMTGLRLAARDPDRVDRLAVLCSSASVAPQGFLDRAAQARAGGTAALAPAVVGRWLTPPFATDHPGLVSRLEAMMAAADDAGYAACCEAIAGMDLGADLRRIVAPTLVVSGADDLALPPEHQQSIAEHVAGAELLTVGPAAHLANLERTDEVTAALLAHLDPQGTGHGSGVQR